MHSKLKLMTVVGTRPEIIRLSEVLKKCDRYFHHMLVHTGQNYDYALNEVFFQELGLRKPDIHLEVVGAHLGETMGRIIQRSYEVFREERPDALLILGDTNSALCAISAKRLKIPIFHMEAGNRCFDENLPEEINRRIVDHISDVNLPYTEHARRYLLQEGVRKDFIFVTGSPMREVVSTHLGRIESSDILDRLELREREYFLVTAHREENIDHPEHFQSLMNSINRLAEVHGLPVIYSTHPRSRKFIQERNFRFHSLVKSLPPFGFFDFNKLQMKAKCVVSDSGTVPEESSVLGFPAVVIRTSTERPEAMEKGIFVLAGIQEDRILQSVQMAMEAESNGDRPGVVADYQDTAVSTKVIKVIQSYTGPVNQFIWRKNLS